MALWGFGCEARTGGPDGATHRGHAAVPAAMRIPQARHVSMATSALGARTVGFAVGAVIGVAGGVGMMVCTGVGAATWGDGVDGEAAWVVGFGWGEAGGVATGCTTAGSTVGTTDGDGVPTLGAPVGDESAGVDTEAPQRGHSEEPRGIAMPHAVQWPVSTPTGLTFGGSFAGDDVATGSVGIGRTGGDAGSLVVSAMTVGARPGRRPSRSLRSRSIALAIC